MQLNKHVDFLNEGMLEIINPNQVYGIYSKSHDNLVLPLDIDEDIVSKHCKDSGCSTLFIIGSKKVQNDIHESYKLLRDEIKKLFYLYVSGNASSSLECTIIMRNILNLMNENYKIASNTDCGAVKSWIKEELVAFCDDMFESPRQVAI